jgi:hypothetical protein
MRKILMLMLVVAVLASALTACARKDGPGFRHDYRGGVESAD